MYQKIADLEFEISELGLQPLEQKTANFTRKTTVVNLLGNEKTGSGEDVTYDPEDQAAFQQMEQPELRGKYSLRSFSQHLKSVELWPQPPKQETSKNFRIWAFESAALSLALKQNELTLATIVGQNLQPLNFVVSMGLGEQPDLAPLRRLKSIQPNLRFKIDTGANWTEETVDELAQLDAVAVIDFKAHYDFMKKKQSISPKLYQKILRSFPGAFFEDPTSEEKFKEILQPYQDRITWDAPLHSLSDVQNLAFPPKVINIKPSRFGTISELFAVYEYCQKNNIGMYAGGQFEIGHGRLQGQYLASLFHPDSPNDLAPSQYNSTEKSDKLPAPPLTISEGF